jgi:hypothetical protein
MRFLNFLRPNDTVQENRFIAVWSILTAAFYVTAMWGSEISELGLGMAIYLAGVFGLFLWLMRRRGQSLAANAYWIVPGLLLTASYLLYSNPFVKGVNILVLPAALAVFYGLAQLSPERRFRWSAAFAATSMARLLSPVTKLFASARVHASLGSSAKQNRSTTKSVVTGLVLMLAVVAVVVLPLLASADAAFAGLVDTFLKWFQGLLDAETVARILVGILLSLVTVAALLAWGREPGVKGDEGNEAQLDSIVVGIVLGGLLAVYLVFLLLQAKNLVVGQLPFAFETAVYMVKSGFWQLIMLSALNIAVFALAYRRTVPAVQAMLGAFAAASLLLVFSAAHRMGLYVTYYGFSYEKFYAAMAVVFCVAVFGYLLTCLARRRRADALRFAAVLFIWMYAVAAVFPVEQFVWRANIALAKLPGSHIRLYELSMLSTDVWGAVNDRLGDGTLAANEKSRVPDFNYYNENPSGDNHWRRWLDDKKTEVLSKHWYQMNLSDVFTMMDIAGK